MKSRMIFLTFVLGVFFGAKIVNADSYNPVSSFESVIHLTPQITIPTVVEVEVPVSDGVFAMGDYVVLEDRTGIFQAGLYREFGTRSSLKLSVETEGYGERGAIVDGSLETWEEFPLTVDAKENHITLHFSANRMMSSTGFSIKLEPFVAGPRFVEVSLPGKDSVQPRIVLAKTSFDDNAIRFPKTISDRFDVTFWYTQPLRVSEVSFFDEGMIQKSGTLRFLAQPGETYSILFDADGPVNIQRSEPANLADDRDVVRVSSISVVKNTAFVPSDSDQDGIPDRVDNCTQESNPNQQDENNNGRGDVCDDYDKDSVVNAHDNCPANPNRNQGDIDSDGLGDACDYEESRILERNEWLIWAAIAFGVTVVIGLFISTVLQSKNHKL